MNGADLRAAVTTSQDNPLLQETAQITAKVLQLEFIPRQRRSLEKIKTIHGLDLLIVVEHEQIVLKGEEAFFWHPGMAVPRLKALRKGKKDPMVEATGLREGCTLLDCTLGLASDALVSAYIVGTTGHVTGLEKSKFIAFITKWGLENFKGQNAHIKNLTSRINVLNASYEEYLQEQPDNSYDIVYFDPMFRQGYTHSSSMNALRPLADDMPLSPNNLLEAIRVARARVVLKESSRSQEFHRLGAHWVQGGAYSPVAYGVWEKRRF